MARIERIEGILEHHLDRRHGLDVAHLDAGRLDFGVGERDLARACRLQAEQDLRERRLAAAGLTDDRDRLAFARLEADRLVGLDDPPLPAAEDLVGGNAIVLLEIVDLQDRRAGLHRLDVATRPLRQRRPIDLVEADAAAVVPLVSFHLDHRDLVGIAAAGHEMLAARAEIAALRPLVRQRQLTRNGD